MDLFGRVAISHEIHFSEADTSLKWLNIAWETHQLGEIAFSDVKEFCNLQWTQKQFKNKSQTSSFQKKLKK